MIQILKETVDAAVVPFERVQQRTVEHVPVIQILKRQSMWQLF